MNETLNLLPSQLLQIVLLLVFLIVSFRYAGKTENRLYLTFYAMAICTLLISNCYYFVHDALRPDVRFPFAAYDIADFGFFLLYPAALNAAVGKRGQMTGLTLAAAAFAAANAALWIAWSGEWMRDIFGGVAFGYFVCSVARGLKTTAALRRGEWIALGAFCALLIAVQTVGILSPDSLRAVLDAVAYGMLFAVDAWILVRILISLHRRQEVDQTLALCFAGDCWIFITMYMSENLAYTVAANCSTLMLTLTFLAVRKKVRAA